MSIQERTTELDDEMARKSEEETNDEAKRPVEVTIMKEGTDYVEAMLVIEKRLTDSDLDEEKGHFSIPEDQFKKALVLHSRNEKNEMDSGGSVPVKLAELSVVDPVNPQTALLLRKSKTKNNYELSGGGWDEFKGANEEKLKGVNGLHAVIRLFCFRLRSGLRFAFIVKQHGIPERLINRLELMPGATIPVFLAEKRLTDSDLDQDEGCLSIPETELINANLFTPQETESLHLGQPVDVGFVDCSHDNSVETNVQLIRKPDKGYVLLSQHWNDVIARNDRKLVGVDELHAIIHLWFFLYRAQIYFALNVAEEAKAWDAVTIDESGYIADTEATASASDGSGSSNTNTGDADV